MVEAANRRLAGRIEVNRAEAGLHLLGTLPQGVHALEASRRAEARGVEAPALSGHAVGRLRTGGLLLGYAALDNAQIHEEMRELEAALA